MIARITVASTEQAASMVLPAITVTALRVRDYVSNLGFLYVLGSKTTMLIIFDLFKDDSDCWKT